ncbi:MAG: NAD-dependent epimerase/dehydratase family protein [Candidatus Dormiibacterota bacterium]
MSAAERVLVTGAGGQLGGHAAHLLARSGKHVYGTVRGSIPAAGEKPPAIRWLSCDFSKPDEVRAAVKASNPSLVLHAVGLAGIVDMSALVAANVTALEHLIESLEDAPLDCLLVIGSGAEYSPGRDREPIREDHPLGPSSPYGLSKLRQFEIAQRAAERGLPVAYGRPFNLIGPGVSCVTAVGDISKRVAEAMQGQGPRVIEVGDLNRWRDYLDVRDAATACALLLENASPGDAYNICSGVPVLMSDVVDRLFALADDHLALQRVELSASPDYVVGDSSKLRGLGWSPEFEMDTSLRDGLQYIASRLSSG